MAGFAFEIDSDDVGIFYVVSAGQKLLDQFGSALSYRHCAERAVTRMAVAAEDHLAAAAHALAHISVYDRLMRRNEYASVLLRRRQTEHVIVLVDRTAYRAKTVVAVGQHVRERELLQTARLCGLDYAHVGDVVRRERVESDIEQFALGGLFADVVRRKHRISHRALVRLRQCVLAEIVRLRLSLVDQLPVDEIHSACRLLYHILPLWLTFL